MRKSREIQGLQTPDERVHWTQRWQEADLSARFEMVWNDYYRALHKVAHQALRTCDGGRYAHLAMNYQWAQDAVQDGLILAFQYLADHPEVVVRYPAHWLCKIVRRAAVALAHKNYRAYLQYTIPLPWTEEDLPEEEAIELFLAKYQAALPDGLTETIEQLLLIRYQKQQATIALETVLSGEELFVLRAKYDDGRSYEEIATITNKPVGTLKPMVARAIAKAKAEYERQEDETLLAQLAARRK